MILKISNRTRRAIRAGLVLLCAFAIGRGDALAFMLLPSSAPQANPQAAATIPAEQLDSLVAPIALYPDPLLAQVLAASTYPLELVQLQQWLSHNSGLSGEALSAAVAKQQWDPSVQAMAAFPDVVKNMTENIQWTTDLGNAFLAQESGVMAAVQRMRARAQSNGKLESTPQQIVQTETVDNRPIIAIEQADPQVVYVPAYDPAVVYGAAPAYYPYPPISYPSWYSSSGFWTGAAIGFGTGIALGAWGGGGWGWRPGWGHGSIDINRNNNFVRHSNFYRGGNSNVWRHNAAHRGSVAYGNRATAGRYGGTFSGANASNRAAAARQQINRQHGNLASTRAGAARSGAVATSGRNFATQHGNVNRGARTSGNLNRAAGTAGRNYSGQNRGNRGAVGTTGMTNRAPGSFNRGASGVQNRGGSVNRGNFSGNRGSFSGGSRGSFGGGGRRGGGGGGGGGRRGGGGGRGRR
jgi:hypothetical protein